jgi:hypothetical protein
LCPQCFGAISLEYPTNESLALRNVIASQIDDIDNEDLGLGVGEMDQGDTALNSNMPAAEISRSIK